MGQAQGQRRQSDVPHPGPKHDRCVCSGEAGIKVVEARFIIVCERSSDHQMSEAIGRRKHGGVCFGIGDYSSSLDPRCFSLGLNGLNG